MVFFRVWGRRPRTAGACLLAAVTLGLAGCAVGMSPDGPVVGVRVGEGAPIQQAITQGAMTAADVAAAVEPLVAGTPLAPIVGGVGAIATAIAGAWGVRQKSRAERSEGRHVGWEEREQAAVPKPAAAPLPTGGSS